MGEGVDVTVAHTAREVSEVQTTDTNTKTEVEAGLKQKEIFQIIEEEVKIIHLEGDEDNGMVMTLITMTETIGTGMLMGKIMPIEAEDGMVTEAKEIVIGEGEEDGTLIPIINNRDIHNNPTTQIPIITTQPQWAINTNIRCLMNNTLLILNHNSNIHHNNHQRNPIKLQIYVNCVKIKAIMIISASS